MDKIIACQNSKIDQLTLELLYSDESYRPLSITELIEKENNLDLKQLADSLQRLEEDNVVEHSSMYGQPGYTLTDRGFVEAINKKD
jgi:predicted transcriptional regulator